MRVLSRLPRIWRRDSFDDALSYAVSIAGSDGIEPLDLLAGVMATSSRARRLVHAAGADLSTIIRPPIPWPDRRRVPGPGLLEESRRVIEAARARALRRGGNPTAVDLLVALASVGGPVRDQLAAHGLSRESLPD